MLIRYLSKFPSVLLLVGTGHFLSIWFLSYIINNYDENTVKEIAEYDIAISIISGSLTLGIGQYFSRHIMSEEKSAWALNSARSLRFATAILLSVIGAIVYFTFSKIYGIVFLSSVFFALSVEYALYVKKKQISAAFVSFLKTSGTFLTFLLIFKLGHNISTEHVGHFYFITHAAFAILAACLSFALLGVSWRFDFSDLNFKIARDVLLLGGAYYIYSITKSFIVPIINTLTGGEYTIDAYVIFKLYTIAFGLRRVYIQVMFTWLKNPKRAAQINLIYFILNILGYLTYLGLTHFFDYDLIHDVLKIKLESPAIPLLAFISLSIFPIYAARLLILELDVAFKRISIYSAIIFFILLVATAHLGILGISISIFAFEFIFGLATYLTVRHQERSVNIEQS